MGRAYLDPPCFLPNGYILLNCYLLLLLKSFPPNGPSKIHPIYPHHNRTLSLKTFHISSLSLMDTAPSTVQHVTKASSDELLRKFAQTGHTKRHRKRTRPAAGVIDDQSAGLVERKSLLPPAADRRSAALIWRLGMGRSRQRARGFKNKSVLGTIEKTWRNTVEGASKVFLEKHRNRHKRLINEIG